MKAANWLARARPGALLLASFAAVDFKIHEISRLKLPDVPIGPPRPRQAAPARQWEHQGLPLPSSRRCTGADLRAAYASGATNPVEVLEALWARIDRGDFGRATWSPFVVLDRDVARAAAEASAARWRAGTPLSPVDGLPIPVKDEHDMVGLPTLMGTSYRIQVQQTDSFLVRRLRAGGALVYAKTHLTEIGHTPVGTNPHHHLPRCVYDADRGAGGSSTGSAVAVALGLAPSASGSDAGGSIRIPSALNGVFGIKPTCVRIGRTGNPLALSSLPHLGPIGASTADLVDFLEVTGTVPDPDDPATADVPDLGSAAGAWRAALTRGVKGARIGVDEREWSHASAGVAKLGQEALRALEAEGARIVPVKLDRSRYGLAFLSIELLREATENMGEELDANIEALGLDLQLNSRIGDALPQAAWNMAARGREAIRQEWQAALASCDLVALPTTADVAPRYPRSDGPLAIADVYTIARLCRFEVQSNLTGLPAGTLPVGLHEGLPVGLQLVGDAYDEASVFAGLATGERLGLSVLPEPPAYAPMVAR